MNISKDAFFKPACLKNFKSVSLIRDRERGLYIPSYLNVLILDECWAWILNLEAAVAVQ